VASFVLTLVAGVEPKKKTLFESSQGQWSAITARRLVACCTANARGRNSHPAESLYEKVSNLFCSRQFGARPTSNFRPFHTWHYLDGGSATYGARHHAVAPVV